MNSALADLIRRCWDGNPASRPTFSDIYSLFVNFQVSFNGAEEFKIKKFYQSILNDNKQRKGERISVLKMSNLILPDLKNNFILNLKDFQKDPQPIGKGRFGTVYSAIHKPTQLTVSMKQLFQDPMTNTTKINFDKAIDALIKLNHKFIIEIYGFTKTVPSTIVTEYLPNRTLSECLSKAESKLTGHQKTVIAYGVACGMKFLHHQNQIHLDLKPSNILLDAEFHPRICDFGMLTPSLNVNPDQTANPGTLVYMAPEMMNNMKETNKVDSFSYGMILYEMFTETKPFTDFSPQEIQEKIRSGIRPEFPQNIHPEMQRLISECWDGDATKRPSFENICKQFIDGTVFFEGRDLP
jgi:serine/threonine protein kinase